MLVIKNKSHAVTANITVPDRGAEGVIIAQGGAFAGWSLYAKDGKPKYCYNTLGLMSSTVEGDRVLTPGDHQVRMEFAYDGGGLGQGRHRHPVRRRRQSRRRSRRSHRSHGLFG